MIITGFLGYLNIAQNGLNLIQQNDNNRKFHKSNLITKKGSSFISKRNFSTRREINPIPTSKIVTDFILEKKLEPVYIYENLEQTSTRQKIVEETRGLSGIYLILNKMTKDYYIGSASTNKLHTRFANHLIHFTGSKIVKNAVRKYKISEFAFLILELFPEIVNKENNKDLLNLEDFYLKSLLPNYNILTEAGSNFGYKHTEMTRIAMKANYSQERRDNIANLNKNKKLSKKTIELIKEKALNRKKVVYSEQGILNMKKASKPIIVYNLDYTVYGKYPSITETATNLNCSIKTVIRSLQSPTKLLKRR
jgi:group I intron endonuclease